MYRALWRLLPGPRWLRIVLAIGLGALAVSALVAIVFPWADALVADDPTIGG